MCKWDETERRKERYRLMSERISAIQEEEPEGNLKQDGAGSLFLYFRTAAEFLCDIMRAARLAKKGFPGMDQKALEAFNHRLYRHVTDEGRQEEEGLCYENSYANPAFAVKQLGEDYGPVLCFLFTELQSLIPYAFEQRMEEITIELELFVEIYNVIKWEEAPLEAVCSAVRSYFKDYCMEMMDRRVRELLDPSLSFATDLIMNSDLGDLSYLYRFGEYIGRNELETAAYLNSLPEPEIEAIASAFTEGYRRGFLTNRVDLGKKSTVNIRYTIGFERIVRAAIRQFAAMGLKPTIYRAAVSSIHKKQNLKVGYGSVGPNRQFDYDHRFDSGIYLSKAFLDRKLEALRKAYGKYQELASAYAGPAVIEIFGENPFTPEEKKEAIRLSEKQKKLEVWYQAQSNLIVNEYVKGEETSFTIIAFPIPEIGPDFPAVFAETVKVNTLDVRSYEKIQQRLIDALDRGGSVRITGAAGNRTDLRVMLHALSDPEKETNFENCLADVNIPVGEVFTSPRLAGTEGVLHVSSFYLNDLHYSDLELTFRDGRVASCTCKNFEREEDNVRYVKENLLFQHETLPLGEFAIGTNTTAYRMGKTFGISARLPILIAEKTGPHFAVGDTCYKMSEERRVYNPDGKEIVAKDNECSLLRRTEPEKAYFNCHTDITIPYDELGEISVSTPEGGIVLLKDGRFVLPGTQELNGPLED